MKDHHNATSVEDLSESALVCRDIRHSWHMSNQHVSQGHQLIRKLVCSRCHTARIDTFSWPDLDRTSTKYIYPDKYRLERQPDQPRTTIKTIRSEWYRRHDVRETRERAPQHSQSPV